MRSVAPRHRDGVRARDKEGTKQSGANGEAPPILIYRKSALRQLDYKRSPILVWTTRTMVYSEECRAMARECELMAGDARKKPEIREQFLSLAARWRELAEKFDELDRPTLH